MMGHYTPCTIMSNTCYNNAASDNIALKHNQLSQMKHQLLQRPPPTALSIYISIPIAFRYLQANLSACTYPTANLYHTFCS